MAKRKFGQLGGSFDPREDDARKKKEEEEERKRLAAQQAQEQAYHNYVRATSALGVDRSALARKQEEQAAYNKALDEAISRVARWNADHDVMTYTQSRNPRQDNWELSGTEGNELAAYSRYEKWRKQQEQARHEAMQSLIDSAVKHQADKLQGKTKTRTAEDFNFAEASQQQRKAEAYAATRPQSKKQQTADAYNLTAEEYISGYYDRLKQQSQTDDDAFTKWRDERDALINRYALAGRNAQEQMKNAATPDRYLEAMQEWQAASKAVDDVGGIENLLKLQQEDADADPKYRAKLAGMDLDDMTFLQKAGHFAGGTISGAVKQYGASWLGQYQNAQSGNILNNVESEADEALRTATRFYLGAVDNDPQRQDPGTQNLREGIVRTATALGGDDYAHRVMEYIDQHVAHAQGAGQDIFAGFDLSKVDRDADETYKQLFSLTQSGTGEDLFDVETMLRLQNSANEDLQRAKNATAELGSLGDFAVEALSSRIQSGLDAALTVALGINNMGAVSMLPFGMRAAGGAWAEGANTVMSRGEEIGRDMAKNLNRYAGQAGAIEMATEMLWGSVGAMSKVTNGGALDEVTTKKLTGALQRMAKSDTGAKILGKLGEKVIGGAFEGIEEVLADAANWMLDSAGIIGEDRGSFADTMKDSLSSFVVGAMSGLFGEVGVVGRMQDAQIGRNIRSELKAGDTSYLDSIAAAASQYKGDLQDTFDKIVDKRDIFLDDDSISFADQADKMSNVDLGRLAQAFEEQTQGDDYDDIERAVKRLEKGKDLTERDVARIVRNEAVTDYLAEQSGVEIGEESKTADAIEALKALASQREASEALRKAMSGEEDETAQKTLRERLGEVFSGKKEQTTQEQVQEDTAEMDNATREMVNKAQLPAGVAEGVRGDLARSQNTTFMQQAMKRFDSVADNLERLGISKDLSYAMVDAFHPDQNVVEYAGAATRFYNQGNEGRELDLSTLTEDSPITPDQAKIAYNTGRENYITEAYNGEESGEAGELRVREGVQRDDGTGTGIQTGRVAEGAGRTESGQETGTDGRGRSVPGTYSWAQKVSAADFGIENGSKDRKLQVVQKNSLGVYTDKYVQKASEIVESHGFKFVPFAGDTLDVEVYGKDGEKILVRSRGYYDRKTKTIYARADHNQFTVEQIARHELMHDTIETAKRNGTYDPDAVQKQIASVLGSTEKFDEVFRSYCALYRGTGLSVNEILDEMLCDAAGNMNEFAAHGHGEDAMKALPVFEAAKKVGEKFKAAENVGISVDTDTESAAPNGEYSRETWTKSEYVQQRNAAAKELAAALGVSEKQARAYIDSINSVAAKIADDAVRLDYKSSPGRSSFVSNSEYGGSFDFSTLCKKRRLMTGTFQAIQDALPDAVLSPMDVLRMRQMLLEKGYEASCGLCYVEGSRADMGRWTKEFIRLYEKYNPGKWSPQYKDMITPDGIEEVRLTHPEVYEEYEKFWNNHGRLRDGDPNLFASQQKPKLYQMRTAYDGEILKYFKKDSTIDAKNLAGGVRMQSFSDFEIVHLIDTMQIIMDMSRVGLAGQAYTKVPDFALALGNTGLKINLSLITKGVDANGKLIFDDVEGMNHETAFKIRDQYSKNVGTILVTFTDEQLLAAMADDRIDFIIPFHRSQWKKSQYAAMGLPANTKDYTYQQNEKWIDPSKHTHEYAGRTVRTKCHNYMANEYWDFSKSGKENAEKYLDMCAEEGKRPAFYKFLDHRDGRYFLKADGSTDGYWKLLIDFKMYDNDGIGSPQMAVRPDFNMQEAMRMLDEYEGGHEKFPVAKRVVDQFVKEYKEKHKDAGKFSRDLDESPLAPTFYSKLERTIEAFKGDKLGAASVVSYLKGKGVKDEEIKWSGVQTFLEGKKSVAKAELLEYLRDNRIEVTEEILSDENGDPNIWKNPYGATVNISHSYDTFGHEYETFDDFKKEATRRAVADGYKEDELEWEYDVDTLYMAALIAETGEAILEAYPPDTSDLIDSEFSPEGDTRWSEYTTFGGVPRTYKEILYKLPDSHYRNAAMYTHWGRSGVIAHARVQDVVSIGGEIALFIDEIQSDWHNEGAKWGYQDAQQIDIQKRIKEITAEHNKAQAYTREHSSEYDRITMRIWRKLNKDGTGVGLTDVDDAILKYFPSENKNGLSMHDQILIEDVLDIVGSEEIDFLREYSKHNKMREELHDQLVALKRGYQNGTAPDAPFRNGAYIQYVLKDLLRKAAEGGNKYGYLAWTTGKMQEERWSDKYAEGYRIEYDQDIPAFLKKYGKQWGAKLTEITLDGNGETVPAIEITSAMRDSVLHEGQPMFSRDLDSDGKSLSKQQAEYFKGSKVRDDDGRLLAVYHGTHSKDFTVFQNMPLRNGKVYGEGFYFAPSEKSAKAWGPNVLKAYLNITNPYYGSESDKAPSEIVNLAKEHYGKSYDELSADAKWWGNKYTREEYVDSMERMYSNASNALSSAVDTSDLPDNMRESAYNTEVAKRKTDLLRSLGYDGVIVKRGNHAEYVAFSPEQIKRTDNKRPTNNPDIRFSRELSDGELYAANQQLRKDLSELRSKLKTRTAQKEYWKGQTKTTDGRRARLDDAKKLARTLAKEHGSKIDVDVVGAKLKDLADFCLNEREFDDAFYEEARMRTYEIAHMILDDSEILRDEGDPASYSKLRDYLKSTKLYVPASMQHDLSEDYAAYRKSLAGTVTLTTSDTSATGIDVAYKELQGIFGKGLFPDINHPADQFKRIMEILESFKPVYERMNSYEMADAVEWTANDILGRVVGEEVRQTDPTYADKMEARLKAEREKGREALKQVRAKRDQQVQALKDHYRQMAEDKRAKRIDSENRTRLLNIARRLNNKKLDRVTRALLDQYIGDLDLVSKGLTGKSVHDLQGLQTWYNAYKEKMGEDFIPIKAIEDRLDRLTKKHIKDMTQEEVADLTTILLHLENEIRTANKLIESQEKRNIYAAGMEVIDDIRGTHGKHGALDKYIVTETLSPVREIRKLTGYREHDPLYTATKELADGQRKMLDYQRRAEALFTKWTQDKAFIKRIAGKHAEEITVQGLVNGEMTDVKITPAMRMALYLHAKNDGNMKHISKGGVKIPDMALYKKGKMQEAYDQGVRVVFSRSQINQIASQMAEDERAFADAVSWYYNNMSRGEINETSELLKGFSIAGVDYYYPIDTDGNFLKKEFDAIKRDGSIEGMGFLKERIDNPTSPIMLYDMNDTLNKSISQHSKYVGLAIPVRNFNKLYGVSTFSERDVNYEADPFDRQDWQYDTSVAETVRQKWGAQAAKYIEKMMTDIQNGTGLDRDVWGTALAKARSKYAGAVLNTNASVAFKQTASYPTAAAVVGYAPLMKALKDSNRKVDLDKVAKLTSLLWYRMKGFSNVELGDIGKGKFQIPKALNWIQAMDTWTTRKLWLAAEYYVEANNKDLKRGTEAFDLATAEVYNRIIEETQPNYTMMQRPQILRSESDLTRALSMFKTQPFQNFNILYDAVGNYNAKKAQNDGSTDALQAVKDARKGLARAISSQVISAFVFSLMQFAWDAFRGKIKKYRDDEEDEMTLLSWLKGMGINVLSSVGGMIPFGGYALELGESMVDGIAKALGGSAIFDQTFYGLSENAVESANDMGKALLSITSQITELLSGNKLDESAIRKLVDSGSDIAQFAGIPVSNWIKLAQATAQNVFKVADGEYLGGYKALRVTTDPGKYSSDYYDLLYKAYKNDKEAYGKIYAEMEKIFDPDKIKTAMENRMKKEQGVGSATDLESRWMNPTQQSVYDAGLNDITQSALWSQATDEQQQKALTALYNIALGNSAGQKLEEKIQGGASVGIDQTDYLLFQTALQMSDADGNGSYKMTETEDALRKMTWLTDAERAYLFSVQHPTAKSNPFEVTRGGSMTPELAPTSNAPAWYHPKKYHEPSGQAGDVVKRGEGINPYGTSMHGEPTQARREFEQTLGGDVYRKLWAMASDQNAIYDVYNTMEYIAKDRQAQLYQEKQPGYVPEGYKTDTPAERLTAALAYMPELETDPAKAAVLQKLYEILANGVENGDLYKKDSPVNKLLWKLGF